MTENNPNVGAAPANGAEGTPSPTVSSQGTPPIEGADQLLSLLESRFSSKFDNIVKEVRGLQSRQDKAENSFQERLAKLDQYQGQGLSREQALSRMEAEDAETAWRRNFESKLEQIAARLESGGTQTNGQQKVADVFSSKGLDPKDPRVAPFLVKEYQSPEAMELAAYRLREELASAPSPSQSQSASMTAHPSNVDMGVLREQYINDISANRGNRDAIKSIQKKYIELGLDVGKIGFSV